MLRALLLTTQNSQTKKTQKELDDVVVVNAYVPNSRYGLTRLNYRVNAWDPAFAAYVRELAARGKPVVVAGDLNVAHTDLDVDDPSLRHMLPAPYPGLSPQESASFQRHLIDGCQLVDSFRHKYPTTRGYSWFYARDAALRRADLGWRLDYCLVSCELKARVHDVYMLKDVGGSDHVPLGIVLLKP